MSVPQPGAHSIAFGDRPPSELWEFPDKRAPLSPRNLEAFRQQATLGIVGLEAELTTEQKAEAERMKSQSLIEDLAQLELFELSVQAF